MRVLSKRSQWVVGILLLIPIMLAAVLTFYVPPPLEPYRAYAPLAYAALVLGLLEGVTFAFFGAVGIGLSKLPRIFTILFLAGGLFFILVGLPMDIVQFSVDPHGQKFWPATFFIHAYFGAYMLASGLVAFLRYRKQKASSAISDS